MISQVPWELAAKPASRWLLRRLPAFIFRRYYNAEALEGHIKMRLLAESGATLSLPKELVAPSLEIQGEVFNMSPYLDLDVTAVSSFLSYTAQQQGGVFAACDDWRGFNLPRGCCSLFQLTFWLNQFQMGIVSSCLEKRIPICVYINLDVRSRIGVVRPFKNFYVSNPTVR